MMKPKVTLLLLLLVVLSIATRADNIVVDNTNRSYMVYAPANLGDNRPLLISCHGMNQDANYQKGMLQIESVADTAKFLTVFPQGIGNSWDLGGNRDLNFVLALIDKMVDQYHIDRNRVYLSGFSMGGMFTYHAINRIADKIAAFAPISGYPMGGASYNASRPVPIIHTHGTGDDVCTYSPVPGIIAGWVKFNNCPSTPIEEVSPYRGARHATYHRWGPGDNGVEVALLELKDKGHWISNDVIKTGEVIWNFCKRYSLKMTDPVVRITAPTNPPSYISLGGPAQVQPITMTATASDPDGKVTKVEFFDGDELLASFDNPPYTYTIASLDKGNHSLRAVATDDEGNTGSAQLSVNIDEHTGSYVFTRFTTDGCVPAGWETYDSSERRIGLSSGFSQGCRVLHFTGSQRDFDYGLYARNISGAAHAGYARFAAKTTDYTLWLNPGVYEVYHRLVNWNCPNFSPITIAIEDMDGNAVAQETMTPAVNVGNNATNSFSGTKTQMFTFEIGQAGRYAITFYTADSGWADLIIAAASIRWKSEPTAIQQVSTTPSDCRCYSLTGTLLGNSLESLPKGIYIVNGKKIAK